MSLAINRYSTPFQTQPALKQQRFGGALPEENYRVQQLRKSGGRWIASFGVNGLIVGLGIFTPLAKYLPDFLVAGCGVAAVISCIVSNTIAKNINMIQDEERLFRRPLGK